MLTIKIEKTLNNNDEKMINAIKHDLGLYPDSTLESMNELLNKCRFDNHITGKGGSHLWISRKLDNERIAIII